MENKENNLQKILSTILVIVLINLVVNFISLAKISSKEGIKKDNLTAEVKKVIGQENKDEEKNKINQQNEKDLNSVVINLIKEEEILGSKDAKITLIDFSDFECPFCRRFHEETFPLLKKNFIDSGKAKMVFIDFPLFFHQNAMPASVAAYCAEKQGKFWNFATELFRNGSLNDESYKNVAAKIRLDLPAFENCRKNKSEIEKKINEKMNLAVEKLGIEGTPTLVITDGTRSEIIVGAQPYEVFEETIKKFSSIR